MQDEIIIQNDTVSGETAAQGIAVQPKSAPIDRDEWLRRLDAITLQYWDFRLAVMDADRMLPANSSGDRNFLWDLLAATYRRAGTDQELRDRNPYKETIYSLVPHTDVRDIVCFCFERLQYGNANEAAVALYEAHKMADALATLNPCLRSSKS